MLRPSNAPPSRNDNSQKAIKQGRAESKESQSLSNLKRTWENVGALPNKEGDPEPAPPKTVCKAGNPPEAGGVANENVGPLAEVVLNENGWTVAAPPSPVCTVFPPILPKPPPA